MSEDWREMRRLQREMETEDRINRIHGDADVADEVATAAESRDVFVTFEESGIVGAEGVELHSRRFSLDSRCGIVVEAGTSGHQKRPGDCGTVIRIEDKGCMLFRADSGCDDGASYLSLVLKGNDELELAISACKAIARILELQRDGMDKGGQPWR